MSEQPQAPKSTEYEVNGWCTGFFSYACTSLLVSRGLIKSKEFFPVFFVTWVGLSNLSDGIVSYINRKRRQQ